jgi:Na+/melibiose symporter-like transporter
MAPEIAGALIQAIVSIGCVVLNIWLTRYLSNRAVKLDTEKQQPEYRDHANKQNARTSTAKPESNEQSRPVPMHLYSIIQPLGCSFWLLWTLTTFMGFLLSSLLVIKLPIEILRYFGYKAWDLSGSLKALRDLWTTIMFIFVLASIQWVFLNSFVSKRSWWFIGNAILVVMLLILYLTKSIGAAYILVALLANFTLGPLLVWKVKNNQIRN